MKRSPFYYLNLQEGAIINNGAWAVPGIYTETREEYDAIRNNVGLSDWSTMGKFLIEGADATAFLQYMIVNDVARLVPGQGLYSSMLDENGGFYDDTTVYQIAENKYMMIGSTAGRDKDNERFGNHSKGMNVVVTDVTGNYGILSLQGPKSRELVNVLTNNQSEKIPYFGCKHCDIAGCEVFICRTGFTGELGYELLVSAEDGIEVWEKVKKEGKAFGLKLSGINVGAAILRLEKGYLAGKELTSTTNPYEVGLGWSVRLNKASDFIGKAALKKIKEEGIKRKLMGFVIDEGSVLGVAGGAVSKNDKKVGEVTSSCNSPYVGKSIGFAFIAIEDAVEGTKILVTTGEGPKEAKLCSKNFYDPENLKTKA